MRLTLILSVFLCISAIGLSEVMGADLNVSRCDAIQDTTISFVCYREIALSLNNPSICDRIKNQDPESEQRGKDRCYLEVALKARNLSVCDKIVGSNEANRCREILSPPKSTPEPKLNKSLLASNVSKGQVPSTTLGKSSSLSNVSKGQVTSTTLGKSSLASNASQVQAQQKTDSNIKIYALTAVVLLVILATIFHKIKNKPKDKFFT